MEKQMKNQHSATGKAVRQLAVAFFLTLGSFGSLHAQNNAPKSSDATINYVGTSGENYVFQVDYANAAQKDFFLEIKDQNGFQFYSGRFQDANFKKRFAISKEELAGTSLTFTLSIKGTDKVQTFDVNTTSRLVEEVSVVKL